MFLKELLQGMQRFVCADSLDGSDIRPVGLRGKQQTGAHRAAIEHYRASAAHAMFTTNMGSNQTEIMTQKIDERSAWLNGRRKL